MRGTGNHTPPTSTQSEPPDNTGKHVMAQVSQWVNTRPGNTVRYPLEVHTTIHTESAREIAAWYQSPGCDGIDFADFASTGTITDDLTDAITRQIRNIGEAILTIERNKFGAVDGRDYERDDQRSALRALLAYVRACEVAVYLVGKNIAGYMPESDVYATLSQRDAQGVYDGMLRNDAPEDVARTDECTCGAIKGDPCFTGKLCELCATGAYVRSMITGGNTKIGAKGAGIVIPAESWAGSMSYWVNIETMRYGKFVDEYQEK